MGRRDFLAAIGASAGWWIEAQAQQSNRMRRIAAFFKGKWSDRPTLMALSAFPNLRKAILTPTH
jgi:hypothetical protein